MISILTEISDEMVNRLIQKRTQNIKDLEASYHSGANGFGGWNSADHNKAKTKLSSAITAADKRSARQERNAKSAKNKKMLAIGAGVTGTGLAAAGLYKYLQNR